MAVKIRQRLEDCEDLEIIKKRALRYLRRRPFDLPACAEKCGLTIEALLLLRERYDAEFREVDNKFFFKLEYMLALKAMGRPLPKGWEKFDEKMALMLLNREAKLRLSLAGNKRAPKAGAALPRASSAPAKKMAQNESIAAVTITAAMKEVEKRYEGRGSLGAGSFGAGRGVRSDEADASSGAGSVHAAEPGGGPNLPLPLSAGSDDEDINSVGRSEG